MRSFAAAVLCLALTHTSDARVPHSFRDIFPREAEPDLQPQQGIFEWFNRLLRRNIKPRQDYETNCPEDDYFTFVGSDALGEGWCQDYMGYPNRTVPVQVTVTRYPTLTWRGLSTLADLCSTSTAVYSTDIDTATVYDRVIPSATLTETITAEGAKVKRDGEAKITARAALNHNQAFQLYRRQSNNTDDDNVMSKSFSRACSCHDFEGSVVSQTYTDNTVVRRARASMVFCADKIAGQDG